MQSFTTVTGPETPQQDSPEYIAAMVAKVDGKTFPSNDGTAPPVETPPAAETQTAKAERLLAGKYKSVEDLEKGYAELQKAFSKRTPVVPDNAPPEAPPTDPLAIPTPVEEDPEALLESKGLDFNTFDQEWRENGELSVESYEQLQKSGIPKEMVDAYIQGQQLIAQQSTTRIFDTAGGKEEYTKLVQWAQQNLPKADIEAYNNAIASENIEQMILATRGLKATFEEQRGKAPTLLQGDTSGDVSSGERYNSKAEMTRDMADPRYTKDPAFRNEVMLKLSRSQIF